MARKAATISRPQALAAWLHGVARHLALKCRRRQREARGVEGSPAPPLDELTARDVLLTLDEELQALPEVYRCLEGRTADEATAALGWTSGSLRARLVRGRARLHARLELSVAIAASEGMMGAKVAAMVRVAVVFASGKHGEAAAGVGVSARAAALAEGVVEGMAMTRLKVGLVLALAVGVATAGAGAVGSGRDGAGTGGAFCGKIVATVPPSG